MECHTAAELGREKILSIYELTINNMRTLWTENGYEWEDEEALTLLITFLFVQKIHNNSLGMQISDFELIGCIN